jgi:hypothetical protein
MVQLGDLTSWTRVVQIAAEASRWDLDDGTVERHMAVAFDYVVDVLTAGDDAVARRSDPSGADALSAAKRMRRHALRSGGRRDRDLVLQVAEDHFGVPSSTLGHWRSLDAAPAWRKDRLLSF